MSDIIESCRHWSAEMHRGADAFEDREGNSPEMQRIIEGNRAIGDTLAKAADEIAKLRAENEVLRSRFAAARKRGRS